MSYSKHKIQTNDCQTKPSKRNSTKSPVGAVLPKLCPRRVVNHVVHRAWNLEDLSMTGEVKIKHKSLYDIAGICSIVAYIVINIDGRGPG